MNEICNKCGEEEDPIMTESIQWGLVCLRCYITIPREDDPPSWGDIRGEEE